RVAAAAAARLGRPGRGTAPARRAVPAAADGRRAGIAVIYEYDGTLAGLWSAYETALRGDLRPDDFLPPGAPGGYGLFDKPVPVVTDFTLTEAFGQRLRAAGEAVPGEFVR